MIHAYKIGAIKCAKDRKKGQCGPQILSSCQALGRKIT